MWLTSAERSAALRGRKAPYSGGNFAALGALENYSQGDITNVPSIFQINEKNVCDE